MILLMLAISNIAYGLTPAGINVTTDLKIGAVIHSEEKGEIEALWYKGGEDQTARGDKVVWGFFYANPQEVSWGNINNPEVYVKIWFDASGRVDVNFFHVSVPDIKVYSQYKSDAALTNENMATLEDRYVRQSYENGSVYFSVNKEDGIPVEGYKQESNPTGNKVGNLKIGAIIRTAEKGNIESLWKLGGESTTSRGDIVIWGYFYANPQDVSWGSLNNPESFVKIFVDAATNVTYVNFFHVSVPDIEVYSDFPIGGDYNLKGTTTVSDRYIRHEYQPIYFPYTKNDWSVYKNKDSATDAIFCLLSTSVKFDNGRSLVFMFEGTTNLPIAANMYYWLNNQQFFSGSHELFYFSSHQLSASYSLFRVDSNPAITFGYANIDYLKTKRMSDSTFGELLPEMKTGKSFLFRATPTNASYGFLQGTASLSGFNDALDVFNLCVDGIR